MEQPSDAMPRKDSKKVLVGVDGSERNRAAIRWAIDEAHERDAGLVAVYAWHIPTFAYSAPYFVPVSTDEMLDQGREILARALTESGAAPGTVDMKVVEGPSSAVLRKLAHEPAVELVVVGTRGRGTAADLFLGSTSHALSHHCPKPLVIVPSTDTNAPAPTRVGHIVVGTDCSHGGDNAVRWAADEARQTDSLLEVVLAWTWTSPFLPLGTEMETPMSQQLKEAAETALAETVDRLELHGLRVKLTAREGTAADVLAEQSGQSDMLVVGRRGLGRARELFLGSVSHACTHRSLVPIVVVPDVES